MKPKIGLALGSGSARGLAHIGVLKVLDEYKIPVHHIAGTSIGAVIGAAYAAGRSGKEIEEIALSTSWKRYLRLLDIKFGGEGLLKGKRIMSFIEKIIGTDRFENLNIPLTVIATDFFNGRQIEFDSGNLMEALRASISIPAFFKPVHSGKRLFLDGGITNPLPVDVLQSKKCDVIIGVNVNLNTSNYKIQPNIATIGALSLFIMEELIVKLKLKGIKSKKVVIIQPDSKKIDFFGFTHAMKLISQGETAALKALPKIQKLVKPKLHHKILNIIGK